MDLLSDLAQSVSQNSIFVAQEVMWGNFGFVYRGPLLTDAFIHTYA